MNKLEFLKNLINEDFIKNEPETIKDLLDELIDSLERKNEVLKKMDEEIQFYRKMKMIRESFRESEKKV